MKTFGIISEGITDQIVLENILCGYFSNMDLNSNITFLQPPRDNTDQAQVSRFGGWFNVFEFCKSQRFLEAFEPNDYIIIQIDTDRAEDAHFDVIKRDEEGIDYTPEVLVSKVIDKFKGIFQTSFAEQYAFIEKRIIYAVCVDEIECWLLPLFYTNGIKEATHNCVYHINRKARERFGFYINPNDKNAGRYYDKLSKDYLKKKHLFPNCEKNISFKLFIESLNDMNITL